MPEFSGDRNYQWHHIHFHTHCRPICSGSVWNGVVLTHWLSGMLQPQHLTGPYLPWADCTAWYASAIFVGKKRHRGESTKSQKTGLKTSTHFPAVSAWPWSFACLCRLLGWEDAKGRHVNNTSSFLLDVTVQLICAWLRLHACIGAYFGGFAVRRKNVKQRKDCHHSIMAITMTTDKAMSSCRHSGPCISLIRCCG